MLPVDLRLQRPFGWGVLMLVDAQAHDTALALATGPVAATPTALAIRVRHAQDVELDVHDGESVVPLCTVNVAVAAGPSTDADLAFDGVLDVPSGTLLVGDPDQENALDVGPGRYRVQVWLDDPDHAEHVRIAIS